MGEGDIVMSRRGKSTVGSRHWSLDCSRTYSLQTFMERERERERERLVSTTHRYTSYGPQ